MRVRCRTLFNITRTGVTNRRTYTDDSFVELRNQQSNYETILQIIGMRCGPENISDPVLQDGWWSFSFDVPQRSALDDGTGPLGHLLSDCDGVPMITGLSEMSPSVLPRINTSSEFKNIHFEVLND